MWKLSLLSMGFLFAACGSNSGGAAVDAAQDTGTTSDISGTDATVDTLNDVAGTDALADTAQCLPQFAPCTPDAAKNPCCAPHTCMNMGNGPACQSEGPDIQPPDVPQDVAQDSGPDVGPDVAQDGNTQDTGVSCGAGGGGSFPDFQSFYKDCKADSDCFVAFHQINCCGTQIAFGLNNGGKSGFQSAEAQCQSQYPGCGCAQFMTEAEDGYSSFTNSDFAATCDTGLCRTHVLNAKPTCTPQGLQEPKPVKACVSVADCEFSMTTIDCCGSMQFIGIAKFAKKAYDIEQQKCASGMAICDCMPKPTVLDDGKPLTTDMVPLACVNGACTTTYATP